MDIYLVRHTTPNIKKGICYGQTDLDLADTFLQEFKTIRQQIPDSDDHTIKSSPLKRCLLLANHLGSPVDVDDRLKELDFGDWEMQHWNQIPEALLNPWMKDFVSVRIPNGESYIYLAFRVTSFFDDIMHAHNEQNLIIVTHAGPMRACLASVLNLPLEESFRINIPYGAIFHLKKVNNSLKLVSEIELT